MPCIGCGRGFHWECENDGCDKCHQKSDQLVESFVGKRGRGQPLKDVNNITDPYSTGRKRAATQYPLFKTNPCEWRGKKNCGGGIPIVGCVEGLQQDRHHGPIKNPLRNEPGNVHRICKSCHSQWHAANDHVYDELKYGNLPHRPEIADELELLASDVKRKMSK